MEAVLTLCLFFVLTAGICLCNLCDDLKAIDPLDYLRVDDLMRLRTRLKNEYRDLPEQNKMLADVELRLGIYKLKRRRVS